MKVLIFILTSLMICSPSFAKNKYGFRVLSRDDSCKVFTAREKIRFDDDIILESDEDAKEYFKEEFCPQLKEDKIRIAPVCMSVDPQARTAGLSITLGARKGNGKGVSIITEAELIVIRGGKKLGLRCATFY